MFSPLILAAAYAQEAPQPAPAAPEEGEAELRERVRALERLVDELRGVAAAPSTEIPLDLTTRINGYGAIGLAQHEEQPILGFTIDELVFQYTANLDRKLTFSTEFSLEAEKDGVAVGIEKMEILIAPTSAAQVNAGAFHFILSPWAVTASQGSYRYLPVEIPEALVEEEGNEFLPVDQVGAELRGVVPAGFWQLGYGVAVTNGRAPIEAATAAAGDTNYFKALAGRVGVVSPGGVAVSGGVSYDRIPMTVDKAAAEATELIAGAALHWESGPVAVRSEGYLTRHEVGGVGYTNLSAFGFVGVPIRRTTPFVGVDYVNVDPADPVYQVYCQAPPQSSSSSPASGTSWASTSR